jgi:predicted DNA-binding transcriptional regulator AlpA
MRPTLEVSGRRLLTNRQLQAKLGNVSHMFIARQLERDPTFPKPFKLGGIRKFWLLDEVDAWMAAAAERGRVEKASA